MNIIRYHTSSYILSHHRHRRLQRHRRHRRHYYYYFAVMTSRFYHILRLVVMIKSSLHITITAPFLVQSFSLLRMLSSGAIATI